MILVGPGIPGRWYVVGLAYTMHTQMGTHTHTHINKRVLAIK